MPLYMTSFEAGNLDYYEAEGWEFPLVSGSNLTTISQRKVHLDPRGRGGDYSLLARGNSTFLRTGAVTPPIGGTPRWLHFWFHWGPDDTYTSSFPVEFKSRDGAFEIAVTFLNTGFVEIRRNGNTGPLLATSAGTFDKTVGHWVAIELVVANAGGLVNVYLDDGAVFVTYSGDTQQSRPEWTKVAFCDGNCRAFIDDVIVTDLAEGQITETYGRRVRPTSDAATGLTPSAGGANHVNVSAYDSTGTVTTQDLYGSDGNLLLGTVDFVQIGIAVQGQAGFAGQSALKSGTTTDYGTELTAAGDAVGVKAKIYDTDPDTLAAWTAAGVNALQQGIRSET